MKRSLTALAILFLLATASFAEPTIPPPQGFVNDFASKLSPDTKQKLENLLSNFSARTGIEIAVVTVNFDDMQDYPIEDYALYLGRQWGIGRDSTKRAAVLVVAIKPPGSNGLYNGGTRLEVSRHLDSDLPDGLAGEIIRKMRNDLQRGQFDQALSLGAQTITATLAEKLGVSMDGIDSSQAYRAPAPRQRAKGRGISPFAIIVIVFIFLAIVH
ncbi:MAG: TPM domain-containing protein, partial [Blastocatellia bacterium]